jgi:hypothetical protein
MLHAMRNIVNILFCDLEINPYKKIQVRPQSTTHEIAIFYMFVNSPLFTTQY